MSKYLIKRDGRREKIDSVKIYNAIMSSAQSVYQYKELESENFKHCHNLSLRISKRVVNLLNERIGMATVEEVQDMLVKSLVNSREDKVAESFILYRAERCRIRDSKSSLMNKIEEITYVDSKNSDTKRDNANVDGNTAMGTMLQYGSAVSKTFADSFMIRSDIKEKLDEGAIYIHDKDFLAMGTTTCCQIELDKLFEKGFSTGHGYLRKPKSIASYASLAAIAIQSNQNDQHGGQSIPTFDYYMAPGVTESFKKNLKDNLSLLFDFLRRDIDLNVLFSDLDKEKNTFLFKNKHLLFDLLKKQLSKVSNLDSHTLHTMIKKSLNKALELTNKQTLQAMEGLVHNLNTMHCLPSFQKIWVLDENELKLLPIEYIFNNFQRQRFRVLSFNKHTHEYEWKYVVNCWNNGHRNSLVELTTKKGQKVCTTDNHKFIIRNQNDELSVGFPLEINEVVIAKKFPSAGKCLPAISLDHYTSNKTQNYLEDHIPLTEELAELFGYYVADGSVVGGSQLCFTTCDESIRERIIAILIDIYGNKLTYKDYFYKHDKYKETRFNVGKVWTDCFKDICGNNSLTKKIPTIILQNENTDYLKSFLKGYFVCDARCSYYLEASTVSEELMNDLNYAILLLGAIPYVVKRDNLYSITIGGKASKRIGLEELLTRVPKTELRKDNETTLPLFAVDCSSKTIEYNGDVYDIEVEENANFVVDSGIVVHNSRAGAQVPFSSLNFGTDTSEEGRMVTKNLLLAQEAGLGNGETAIFPILIFKVKEGVNYNSEDPNYDLFKLSMRVSAKRLFPNYVFLDAPFNLQYYKEGDYRSEVATMGCRTRVIGNVNGEETSCGRGNISFNTINLPRLGIKYGCNFRKKNLEENSTISTSYDSLGFFKELDTLIDLSCDALFDRYEFQKRKKIKNFPFLMGQKVWGSSNFESMDEEIGDEILKSGTLSIGFIGLAECLIALIGEHHGESKIAQELGLDIIAYMRKRMDDYMNRTNLNFSLLATPAEGLSGYFTKIDKKEFGIITGVTDKDYYTNSFHIPVSYNISISDKIKKEAPYHELTNAGHITYVEVSGDISNNLEAFESIIRCMKESGIGYGSINHPIDRDPICGYSGVIEGDVCPVCNRQQTEDRPFERIRRITGYLVGTLDRFNNGKKSEEHDRVKHSFNNTYVHSVCNVKED